MFNKHEKAKERILEQIDAVTVPSQMKAAEAMEFLRILGDDLRVRVECLREENDL